MEISFVIAAGLSIGIGLLLGLLGAGGSVLTIPLYVYVLQWPPKVAIASSLAIVASVAGIGCIQHFRQGRLLWKPAIVLLSTGIPFSFLGAHFSKTIAGELQLFILAVVVLVSAILLFKETLKKKEEEKISFVYFQVTGGFVLSGASIGFLTGLVGVGGGFLLVPALHLFGKLPVKISIGTSTFVIAMNALIAFGSHIQFTSLPWMQVLILIFFTTIGLGMGSIFLKASSPLLLQRLFAALLFGVGLFLLTKNIYSLGNLWSS